jgi:drug/metabolite transporter (DMT)-like permease
MQKLENRSRTFGPSNFFKEKLGRAGPILIFIAAMLWATDAPFRYHLTRGLDASFIVLAEHAINVLLILPFIFAGWREIKSLKWKQWISVLVIGIGASAVASILFTKTFSYVNPSVAIVLQKLQPLIAISLAAFFLKERTGKRFWLWTVLALLGAYVISFPDLAPRLYYGEAWNPNTIGVLLALGAAALWGLGTVVGRYLLRPLSHSSLFSPPPPEIRYDRALFLDSENRGKGASQPSASGNSPISWKTLTALRFLIAFLFLIVLNARSETLAIVAALSGKDVLFLIIVAITSGFTSLFIYYKGLETTRASVATLAELGFPFLAVIVNAAALGLFLRPMQIAGMALLLFAVLGLAKVNKSD